MEHIFFFNGVQILNHRIGCFVVTKMFFELSLSCFFFFHNYTIWHYVLTEKVKEMNRKSSRRPFISFLQKVYQNFTRSVLLLRSGIYIFIVLNMWNRDLQFSDYLLSNVLVLYRLSKKWFCSYFSLSNVSKQGPQKPTFLFFCFKFCIIFYYLQCFSLRMYCIDTPLQKCVLVFHLVCHNLGLINLVIK